ncbi:MAG: DeoR/GlpR transcriptional regulator [Phycisphaerales bacterium]|nr:DeoR/GlpR transcriptional regulator [Phycisphaerales bacterium]
MTADERRQLIGGLLARRGYADLSVFVAELGVSESTVRRDLGQMEEEGLVKRTHGGAVLISDRAGIEAYSERESTAVEEKKIIGRTVAALVNDGETILMNGGTTAFQVARHLLNWSGQVVTNSLPIANLLNSAANIELMFIGGYIYPRTGEAFGAMAQGMLDSLSVSKAILGTAGVTAEAVFNANVLMVETQLQMMRCAEEVILVADSSKFGKRALAKICGWDQIDKLVSDDGLEPKWREIARREGVELILAGTDKAMAAANDIDASATKTL